MASFDDMISDAVEQAVVDERARCAAIARTIYSSGEVTHDISAWQLALFIAERIEEPDKYKPKL